MLDEHVVGQQLVVAQRHNLGRTDYHFGADCFKAVNGFGEVWQLGIHAGKVDLDIFLLANLKNLIYKTRLVSVRNEIRSVGGVQPGAQRFAVQRYYFIIGFGQSLQYTLPGATTCSGNRNADAITHFAPSLYSSSIAQLAGDANCKLSNNAGTASRRAA